MVSFGKKIAALRKEKKLSQTELAKKLNTSVSVISRYERNIMTPSIEVIIKISDVHRVSIDFLVGKTNLKRLEEINSLPEDKKQCILNHIDILIRDAKTRQAYDV